MFLTVSFQQSSVLYPVAMVEFINILLNRLIPPVPSPPTHAPVRPSFTKDVVYSATAMGAHRWAITRTSSRPAGLFIWRQREPRLIVVSKRKTHTDYKFHRRLSR